MTSGFCVRALLLSLLALGQHAQALSHRSGGSSGVTPHFKLSEEILRSYKPASVPFSDDGSARPAGPLVSSGPSYGCGRQVDGYRQDGSVSSYRPRSLVHQGSNQNPKRPHHQLNPNVNGILQTKAGMWDFAPNQKGNRFEMGIASSYGIEMHSGRQPVTQQQSQKDRLMPKAHPPLAPPSRPLMAQGLPSKHRPHGSVSGYRPRSLVHQGSNQNPKRPHHQLNPNVNGILQTKAGMWDFAPNQKGNRFETGVALSYGLEMHSGRQPITRQRNPNVNGVLPTKGGMWAFAPKQSTTSRDGTEMQSGHQPESQLPNGVALLLSEPLPPQGLPSEPLPPQGLPSDPLPPQGLPSDPLPPQGLPSDPLPPQGLPSDPLPPQGLPSDPLPPQGLPSDPLPPQGLPSDPLPPQGLPSDPLPPQGLPSKHRPHGSVSSYRPGSLVRKKKNRQDPQQPHHQPNPNVNGVLQTKAGMWDFPPQTGNRFQTGHKHGPNQGVAPLNSRPVPMASLYHPRQRQQLAPGYKGFHQP